MGSLIVAFFSLPELASTTVCEVSISEELLMFMEDVKGHKVLLICEQS